MSAIKSGKSYQDEKFEKVMLEAGEKLTGEFFECTFIDCSFSGAILENCRFNTCVFRDCDLSLVKISGTSFPSTRFENVKMIGVNWTSGDWNSLGIGTPPEFINCVLNHGTFIGVDLKHTQMADCIAREVDFREADLSGVVFGRTDFSGSIFHNTDLSEADLSQASGYSIDPGVNLLKGGKFSLPEALALLYSMDIVLDRDSDPER
jgi:fluoroquinolone resistance protein